MKNVMDAELQDKRTQKTQQNMNRSIDHYHQRHTSS